ncbi:MAG: histidine kinase [Flavobacteriaceae bacterium]|nr:histidine kinase [Flavobacteriaceae bacterium]
MNQSLLKRISSKLFLLIATFYAISLVLSFIKYAYFKYLGYHYKDITWLDFFIEYFVVDYIAVMVFALFVLITTRYMIYKKLSLKLILLIHFSLSIFIGFFIYSGTKILLILIGKQSISQINFLDYLNHIIQDLDVNFLVYLTMVLIIYSYYYVKRIKKIQLEKSTIKEQLANTKLSLLKSNLQPHFLFNTLNSISSLIDTNAKQAQNTIADLADLLREILDLGNQNLIPLEKELNMLEKYLNIVRIRFSDHFEFSSHIDSELVKTKIPSLLLQPIIENSIKHGYGYYVTDLSVHLSVKKINDRIEISVSNNGCPLTYKPKKSSNNIGLKNIVERLRAIYKENYKFSIKNKTDNTGVITNIDIPLLHY